MRTDQTRQDERPAQQSPLEGTWKAQRSGTIAADPKTISAEIEMAKTDRQRGYNRKQKVQEREEVQ